MTFMAQQQRPQRSGSLVPLGVVGVVGLVIGVAIGATWSSGHEDQWHTGHGYVGVREVSVQYHGRIYGAADAVTWIDAEGAWHDDGWPSCLQRFKTQPVRFQARSVTIEDTTWWPIVAIDCRP